MTSRQIRKAHDNRQAIKAEKAAILRLKSELLKAEIRGENLAPDLFYNLAGYYSAQEKNKDEIRHIKAALDTATGDYAAMVYNLQNFYRHCKLWYESHVRQADSHAKRLEKEGPAGHPLHAFTLINTNTKQRQTPVDYYLTDNQATQINESLADTFYPISITRRQVIEDEITGRKGPHIKDS